MGSVIHESAFENDIREILEDEAYAYYDGDTANYRDDSYSYNNERVGWMSREYQTRVRSKNRSKNKAARASRKRNR